MAENVIIIGSGPSGLSAAIYTAREDFKPLVIAGIVPGGQLMLTTTVENMPGFPDGIQGPELIELMKKQAIKFGARIIQESVVDVDFSSRPYKVKTETSNYEANAVIVATGANAKLLGIPSETKHMGFGVSTCATCLPPSSLIVANPSLKSIRQSKVGQRVLTHDGSFKSVAAVMARRYRGSIVGLKTRFFRSEYTFLTPNHPVLVKTLERGSGVNYHKFKWSKPFWLPAGELAKNHVVLYPITKKILKLKALNISKEIGLPLDSQGRVMHKIETYSSHRLPNKISMDSEFARLVGYYLSEGYSHDRGVSFAFNINEIDYANDVKRIIKKKFGLAATIRPEKSVLKVTVYSLILSKLFENLFSKYSHEKKMPHKFIFLNEMLQKEIIKGVWRGDGCIRKKDFVITTSSRLLAEQLKTILLRLKILPQLEKRRFKTLQYSNIEGRMVHFKKNVYQLVVGGPWLEKMSEILGEKHPDVGKKAHRNYHAWLMAKYAHLPIKRIIKKAYDGMVYNLAVNGNNTYVTTNCIVHNCDGPFFKGKDVVVVGGGDTAMEDSFFLTKFCSTVTIVHRKHEFRASKIMQEKVLSSPKIKVVWDSVVEDIVSEGGDGRVTGVKIRNTVTNQVSMLPTKGVFVAIGHEPSTKFLKDKLPLDEQGYVITKNEVMTDIPGVFVAGDNVDRYYRQAGTAASSGIKAALRAREYLQSLSR